MKHFVIDGRIFRVVTVEAADTKEASRHVSAQRPVSQAEAAEIRKRVSR